MQQTIKTLFKAGYFFEVKATYLGFDIHQDEYASFRVPDFYFSAYIQ